MTALSRRGFLRFATALGGAVALASILEGCSPDVAPEAGLPETATSTRELAVVERTAAVAEPAATATRPDPTPTVAAPDSIARVAFVKTENRVEGVRKAIDLVGMDPLAGKSVFLKPNFNSADPAPGSTHPDVLAALVAALQEMGAGRITVGDRSGMGDTRRVMEQIGVFKLADELGFETIVLDELPAGDWVIVQEPGSHWGQGFPLARPCVEAQALVQTCCLKTHRYGGHFTLSLKNSVGMVGKRIPSNTHDFMRELHSSPHQRRMIAEINAAYTPALVVMDGVEAFISGGPDAGERVRPGVILAGTDRVALDAVGVALLRRFGCQTEAGKGPIFAQEQIARAVELGIGVDSPEKIEFLTGDADSAAYSQQIKELLLAG